VFIHNGLYKLGDLGFSCFDGNKVKTERSNLNVGSPNYMSPEALNQSRYSVQSDIFSLGITFY